MERLLKAMICPDYHKRLTASQAHRHVALQPQHKADHLSTPPFVRTATGLADHQAKRRREPQPKAKLPKRDHVRREAPPDARADGDPNCQFQSVQEVTERRSVTGIEHVTPRKKAPGHIIVITPTAEHTTDVADTEHNTEAIEGPKKRSKANQISGERPRVNAMTTMEGQRKPESINPSAVHDGLISATESSGESIVASYSLLLSIKPLLSISRNSREGGSKCSYRTPHRLCHDPTSCIRSRSEDR